MFLRAALAAIVLNQISHHAGAFHLPFQLRHNTYKARVYDSPLVNSISRGGCDTTGTTTKSSNTNTLFPSPRFQEDRSSKQFAVLSTGDEPTSSNKPLLRRLYENSIGRLWKACLLLFVSVIFILFLDFILFWLCIHLTLWVPLKIDKSTIPLAESTTNETTVDAQIHGDIS